VGVEQLRKPLGPRGGLMATSPRQRLIEQRRSPEVWLDNLRLARFTIAWWTRIPRVSSTPRHPSFKPLAASAWRLFVWRPSNHSHVKSLPLSQ
jgi:hypothetical protein